MVFVTTTMSSSYAYALVDDWKNTTSASFRGSRPFLALVRAGCSVRWWCSFQSSTSANTKLTHTVVITCNLSWWCFLYVTWPIYVLMRTNALVRFATCNVWWWWCYVYVCSRMVLYGWSSMPMNDVSLQLCLIVQKESFYYQLQHS